MSGADCGCADPSKCAEPETTAVPRAPPVTAPRPRAVVASKSYGGEGAAPAITDPLEHPGASATGAAAAAQPADRDGSGDAGAAAGAAPTEADALGLPVPPESSVEGGENVTVITGDSDDPLAPRLSREEREALVMRWAHATSAKKIIRSRAPGSKTPECLQEVIKTVIALATRGLGNVYVLDPHAMGVCLRVSGAAGEGGAVTLDVAVGRQLSTDAASLAEMYDYFLEAPREDALALLVAFIVDLPGSIAHIFAPGGDGTPVFQPVLMVGTRGAPGAQEPVGMDVFSHETVAALRAKGATDFNLVLGQPGGGGGGPGSSGGHGSSGKMPA
jgi:hypothetical protein